MFQKALNLNCEPAIHALAAVRFPRLGDGAYSASNFGGIKV